MIKVRVVRDIHTVLPLASGVLALSSSNLACAPSANEEVASNDSALDEAVVNPGTGVFELNWAYGSSTGYDFTSKNSTDEHVRALETMTFSLPASFAWQVLHPSEPFPTTVERLNDISVKVSVTFYRDGATYGERPQVETTGWVGSYPYGARAQTSSFTVDRRAQSMKFSVEITDRGVAGPPATRVLGEESFAAQPVIGGTLPNKTLLFDTYYRDLRSRVLEGGEVLEDATLQIGYTDWRAATLVDSSSLDRQIGTATSYSRFGAIEIPIYGDLEYEITRGVAIDDAWQGEQTLAANGRSTLIPNGQSRVCYEGNISVPKGARSLQVYFHVRAFLKVDYSRFHDIRWRKYADGERILLREKWDNEHGTQDDNYDFSVRAR